MESVPSECLNEPSVVADEEYAPQKSAFDLSVENIQPPQKLTPKQIYNEKCLSISPCAVKASMSALFEMGFTDFNVNKLMLARYNNEVEAVAEQLVEGNLSESQNFSNQ